MDAFDEWIRALETRHLADLSFRELSAALRALSSLYVERRAKLGEHGALASRGKRAAFALFYGPLHYLLVREIAKELGVALSPTGTLVDLGCGTGASGAALASACGARPPVVAIDRNAWALSEAMRTYRAFGLSARARRGNLATSIWPKARATFLAAFAVNELAAPEHHQLLARLTGRADRKDAVLVVEPLAGFVAPWWCDWRSACHAAGGRADEWRFQIPLPPIVAKLDRAAGLNHRELTGRSLWIPSRSD